MIDGPYVNQVPFERERQLSIDRVPLKARIADDHKLGNRARRVQNSANDFADRLVHGMTSIRNALGHKPSLLLLLVLRPLSRTSNRV